jgi:hypothetical protein
VRITVDGEQVKEWPYFEEFYVEPGKHFIKAIKSGYWLNQTEEWRAGGFRARDQVESSTRIGSQSNAVTPAARMTCMTLGVTRSCGTGT